MGYNWQAIHAFEGHKDPHYWGGFILTSFLEMLTSLILQEGVYYNRNPQFKNVVGPGL